MLRGRPAQKRPVLSGGRNWVGGSGPQPARVMLLGEGPGQEENNAGLPFVGRTGAFLDSCLEQVGIDRAECRVENVTRYLPAKKGELTQAEVDRDRPDLIEAFRGCQPDFVFAMGRHAAEALLGSELRGLGFSIGMDWVNGLTFYAIDPSESRSIWVTVAYHPAAGLRNTGAAAKFYAALRAFKEVLIADDNGEPFPMWDIEPARAETFKGVAMDTESLLDGSGWCATWSESDQDLFIPAAEVPDFPVTTRPLILHNAVYDWNVLLGMGWDMAQVKEWHDTLMYARACQTEPGKLKLLAQRYLGVARTEYKDLLAPYAKKAWAGWMAKAVRRAPQYWALKDGQEQSLATRLKSGMKSQDPEKWFEDLPERYQARLSRTVGPIPKLDLSHIPFEVAKTYALQDANDTRRLFPILRRKVQEIGAEEAVRVDEGMIPMLARMERVGMPIDQDRLREVELEMGAEVARLDLELKRITGNPNFMATSAPQVAGFLFYEIGVGGRRKKTATGKDSTEAGVLDSIRAGLLARKAKDQGLEESDERALEFLEALGELRHVGKLLSTNITPLWGYIDKASRVHPRFKQGGYDDEGEAVVSGRYAMDKPNWLAFPKHSKWAHKARSIVKPQGTGRVILVVDLDQIEMREHAELSGCAEMLRIFNSNEDIHCNTARYVFGVEAGKERQNIPGLIGNEVTYRQASKTLGFLLLFGGSAWGFAKKMAESGLLLSDEEATRLRDGWLELYDGTIQFWERVWAETEQRGYSATPLGRPRYLPHIWSKDEYLKAEAQRQAVNHQVQGGAAEIIKIGAARVYKELAAWQTRGYVEPLITIHDELDFEIDEGMAEQFGQRVVELLSDFPKMRVKVKAKPVVGPTWGDTE